MTATLHLAGETLHLLPQRALYWEQQHTLLVADPHFGKAAAFRAHGVPVPDGTTADALSRLTQLLLATEARRLVFLGDLHHAPEGRVPRALEAVARWRGQHRAVKMLLVRGNHDHRAGDPGADIAIVAVDAPLVVAPFVLAHYPGASPLGYVLAGHLHPRVRVTGAARQSVRVPCFWFTSHVGVLPAFGDFTGQADAPVAAGDRVWGIADGQVLPLHDTTPT